MSLLVTQTPMLNARLYLPSPSLSFPSHFPLSFSPSSLFPLILSSSHLLLSFSPSPSALLLFFHFPLISLSPSPLPPRCSHFSNFGLLFSASSNEDWTTFRILSISLFLGAWVILGVFMLLVQFSASFRVTFGFESGSEFQSRVLGDLGENNR